MTRVESESPTPPPGSEEAVELGCLCPVLDNARGVGYLGVPGRWVVRADCPVHGGKKSEDE